MKKWHILVAVAVVFITMIIVAVSLIFRYVVVPKYLEPIAEQVSEALKDDDLIDALYDQAGELHADGVLDDDIYSNFLAAYSRHNRDNEFSPEYTNSDSDDESDPVSTNAPDSSGSYIKRAKYASTKVGMDLVQTNDGESDGKANTRYSQVRNSNRTKAEDIVEAEKNRSNSSNADLATENSPEPEIDENQAWQMLMDNMTASEAARFRSIISKLDRNILRSYHDNQDMDGLKAYLHANLNNAEYKDIVNMGYKYMNLFI